jgi:hypothetical protein
MIQVLLATLTPGNVSAHYCSSLADLLKHPLPDIDIEPVFVHGGPATAHQRNTVCKYFLESPADKLLFVDADIKFTPTDLQVLLDSNKEIVGARAYGYSQTRDQVHPNWRPISSDLKEKGLIECSHIGMDFTLISREALEIIGVRPAEGWPYGHGIVNGLYTSTEDILFCHSAREAGLQIFVNADARVYHAKTRLV